MENSTKIGLEKFQFAISSVVQKELIRNIDDLQKTKAFSEFAAGLFSNDKNINRQNIKLSPEQKLLRRIFFGFIEIASTYEVLLDCPKYIKRYPSKNIQISKNRFLRYHVANYLNEIYILRERLDGYRTMIIRSYRNKIEEYILEGTNKKI